MKRVPEALRESDLKDPKTRAQDAIENIKNESKKNDAIRREQLSKTMAPTNDSLDMTKVGDGNDSRGNYPSIGSGFNKRLGSNNSRNLALNETIPRSGTKDFKLEKELEDTKNKFDEMRSNLPNSSYSANYKQYLEQ
jgi:hypothetical protein